MRITESRLRQIVKQMLKEAGPAAPPAATPAVPSPPAAGPAVPGKTSAPPQPLGAFYAQQNKQLVGANSPQINFEAVKKINSQLVAITAPGQAVQYFLNQPFASSTLGNTTIRAALGPQNAAAVEAVYTNLKNAMDVTTVMSAIYTQIIKTNPQLQSDVFKNNYTNNIGPLLYATLAREGRLKSQAAAGAQPPAGASGAPAAAPTTPAENAEKAPNPLPAPAAGLTGPAKNWLEYISLTPRGGQAVQNAWINYAGGQGIGKGFKSFVRWYNNVRAARPGGKHLTPNEVVQQLNVAATGQAGAAVNALSAGQQAIQDLMNPNSPSEERLKQVVNMPMTAGR